MSVIYKCSEETFDHSVCPMTECKFTQGGFFLDANISTESTVTALCCPFQVNSAFLRRVFPGCDLFNCNLERLESARL